jgi:hypothetical protein
MSNPALAAATPRHCSEPIISLIWTELFAELKWVLRCVRGSQRTRSVHPVSG